MLNFIMQTIPSSYLTNFTENPIYYSLQPYVGVLGGLFYTIFLGATIVAMYLGNAKMATAIGVTMLILTVFSAILNIFGAFLISLVLTLMCSSVVWNSLVKKRGY